MVQIDTDSSQDYGIEHTDDHGHPLTLKALLEKTSTYLKLQSTLKSPHLASQLLLAIGVHSLECWLLPLHTPQKHEIEDCFEVLKQHIKTSSRWSIKKRYQDYQRLSQDFLDRETLYSASQHNVGFLHLLEQLQHLLSKNTK